MREAIDDSFVEGGRDADAWVEWLRGKVREYPPRRVETEVLDLRVEGDVATARVRVTADVAAPYAYRMPPIEGVVELARGDGRWRFTRARRE